MLSLLLVDIDNLSLIDFLITFMNFIKVRCSRMTKTRVDREKRTVEVMIKLYCQQKHTPSNTLCSDCQQLLSYALQRVEHCKFGENKTVCGDCPVHCYKQEMREKIQGVMRYSGPRMLLFHPLMAFQHILDRRRKPSQTN